MEFGPKIEEAFKLAQKARLNAYADYSGVKVGSAMKIKGVDEIYYGANVEYVVNGISVCAERSALSHAVSNNGKIELEFIVVCSNTEPALLPCGVCCQAISEFGGHDLPLYIGNKDKLVKKVTFGDVWPNQYSELPKVLSED
jgi:cytidine deaminase